MEKVAIYIRLSKEDIDKINMGDNSESIKIKSLCYQSMPLEKGGNLTSI